MDDSEGEETDSYDEVVDPKVMVRIEKISDVLRQTNQNLQMFEKLLPAYRHDEGAVRLMDEGKELQHLRQVNQELSARLSELGTKNNQLEEKLKTTEAKCDEFTMENMKLMLANEDLLDKLAQLKHMMDQKPVHAAATVATAGNSDASSKGDDDGEAATSGRDIVMRVEGTTKCVEGGTSESEVESVESVGNDIYANYSRMRKRVKCLKDSRNKLKKKTRELLRHYRTKRNLLEKRERQLMAQKSGLLKLQDLHQNYQSSQKVLVDYLGQEFRAISKLIFLLLPEETEPPDIEQCGDNMPLWYSQIDNLAEWTKQKLIGCMLRLEDGSQTTSQHVLFRKLRKTTLDEETLATEVGTKQLSSISENLSICSDSQHTTIRSMIQEIEM